MINEDQLYIKMSYSDKQHLKRKAKEVGKSMSQFVREALIAYEQHYDELNPDGHSYCDKCIHHNVNYDEQCLTCRHYYGDHFEEVAK